MARRHHQTPPTDPSQPTGRPPQGYVKPGDNVAVPSSLRHQGRR